MYVFGVDVPLVELFLVVTVFIAILFALLVYTVVKIVQINKKLDQVMDEEDEALKDFKKLSTEEGEVREDAEKELKALNSIKTELKQVLSNEQKELSEIKGLENLGKLVKKEEKELKAIELKEGILPKADKKAKKVAKKAAKKAAKASKRR
jgi:hypothetical protein